MDVARFTRNDDGRSATTKMICRRSFFAFFYALFVNSLVVHSRSAGSSYLQQSLQNLQESLQSAQNAQAGNAAYTQGNPSNLAQQLNLANLAGVAGVAAPSSDLVDTYDSLEHLHQDILKSGLYQNEPYPADASQQRQQQMAPSGSLASIVQQPQPQPAASLAAAPSNSITSIVQQPQTQQAAALALQQLQANKAVATPSALEKAILDFLVTERVLKYENGRFVPDDQGLL